MCIICICIYKYIYKLFFQKHIFSFIRTHTLSERYIPSYLIREWLLACEGGLLEMVGGWGGGKGWFQWKRPPTRPTPFRFLCRHRFTPPEISQTSKILYGMHAARYIFNICIYNIYICNTCFVIDTFQCALEEGGRYVGPDPLSVRLWHNGLRFPPCPSNYTFKSIPVHKPTDIYIVILYAHSLCCVCNLDGDFVNRFLIPLQLSSVFSVGLLNGGGIGIPIK